MIYESKGLGVHVSPEYRGNEVAFWRRCKDCDAAVPVKLSACHRCEGMGVCKKCSMARPAIRYRWDDIRNDVTDPVAKLTCGQTRICPQCGDRPDEKQAVLESVATPKDTHLGLRPNDMLYSFRGERCRAPELNVLLQNPPDHSIYMATCCAEVRGGYTTFANEVDGGIYRWTADKNDRMAFLLDHERYMKNIVENRCAWKRGGQEVRAGLGNNGGFYAVDGTQTAKFSVLPEAINYLVNKKLSKKAEDDKIY